MLFDRILADNWFGATEKLECINNVIKKIVIGIKSNRTVALSEKEKLEGALVIVKQL